ncbi:MAG: cysteine--tRNA ligase [Prolixibacteraceae bacterium]|jgi:cysteinyl-tRNA synthetase|nr:cysteine--tRNA ligase [Prolixibacteraceae bacterium]
MEKLTLHNTLTRKKELFVPIHKDHVGMYVCGPTVYGNAHLGHARPAITFDLLFRYLLHIGYKVRYVRNITDVGHLVNDADEGEDKVAKKAKVEELEPMEIVQIYTNSYRKNMAQLNVLPPSIEPTASGHIIEQIEAVKKMLAAGFAYETNGSVYFDVEAYAQKHPYGILSGRKIEDLYTNTRDLDGQTEKRSGLDFALWKNALPEHIMRWPSPWGIGFPGWHTECTAMSTKYLGETFDIHGGGLDLLFPHHEAEVAQGVACFGHATVNYWIHNNMITINGQKMGKSLGNFIQLDEFFTGNHPLLEKAYDPMTIRFFMLQAHYRSPLDFSNEALQAAEKGLERLMNAMDLLKNLKTADASTLDIENLKKNCYDALNDDLNSPILIAHLFDGAKMINSVNDGNMTITAVDLVKLQQLYAGLVQDVLGLQPSGGSQESGNGELFGKMVELLLTLRQEAKAKKDWATSDQIRDRLTALGFEIKDTKVGADWKLKN